MVKASILKQRFLHSRLFHVSLVMAGLGLLAVIAILVNRKDPMWFATHAEQLVSWGFNLAAALVFIGERTQPVRIWWAKLRAIWSNPQVVWNLVADYEGGSITTVQLGKLKSLLKGLGRSFHVLVESGTGFTVQVDGMNIIVDFYYENPDDLNTEESDVGHIRLRILDYHAPYRETSALLGSRIIPLLGEVESICGRPRSQYAFGIVFEKKHPFLGLYLRNLDPISFQCQFRDTSLPWLNQHARNLVTVTSKELQITTNQLTTLQGLVDRHLMLGAGG